MGTGACSGAPYNLTGLYPTVVYPTVALANQSSLHQYLHDLNKDGLILTSFIFGLLAGEGNSCCIPPSIPAVRHGCYHTVLPVLPHCVTCDAYMQFVPPPSCRATCVGKVWQKHDVKCTALHVLHCISQQRLLHSSALLTAGPEICLPCSRWLRRRMLCALL